MTRIRATLGIIAGAMFLASSAAHSFLGWKQLGGALAKTSAPPELVKGLSIGWHFAGFAMLTFGIIVLWIFTEALKRRSISLRPALIIAVAYLAFGIWALIVSRGDLFFLVFIVPGLLLVFAAWGPWPDQSTANSGARV
jgi:hypothetical protein